mmetsp:Transcript_45284/g.98061  ORF Transcript_45284/g.98061 Transcript_45284/m.98061 type:complete len:213 (+) Transcript_45284:432-1070(+)
MERRHFQDGVPERRQAAAGALRRDRHPRGRAPSCVGQVQGQDHRRPDPAHRVGRCLLVWRQQRQPPRRLPRGHQAAQQLPALQARRRQRRDRGVDGTVRRRLLCGQAVDTQQVGAQAERDRRASHRRCLDVQGDCSRYHQGRLSRILRAMVRPLQEPRPRLEGVRREAPGRERPCHRPHRRHRKRHPEGRGRVRQWVSHPRVVPQIGGAGEV